MTIIIMVMMKNLNWFLLQQQHHQFIMINAGKQVICWKQKAKCRIE